MSELTKKSLRYLQAINENGGGATTTEIRDKTGMTNSAVNYRHNKLEQMAYVDIEQDHDLTPYGMTYCKRAVLTDYAKEQIANGLLVETEQEAKERPSVETNAERIDDVEDTVETIRDVFNNEISPDLVEWRDLTIQLLLYLDRSNDIEVSLQDLIELEVDQETATYVIKRVQRGNKTSSERS